jgi:uncharacterized protein YbjT (DUF2867 family)
MASTAKSKTMKILVLGANGQIGSLIFTYLQSHFSQHNILGTSRKTLNKPGKNFMQFDPFTDDWNTLGKIDVLINCIGIIAENRQNTFRKIHIALVEKKLQQRENKGNAKIIHISALGANAWSQSKFLSTKAEGDNLLLKAKNTVVIRPSIVCTHNTMLVKKLKMLKRISKLFFGHIYIPSKMLSVKIQPIMPEDLAEIVSKVCFSVQHPQLINAVGPEALSINEILYKTKNVKIKSLPDKIMKIPLQMAAFLFPQVISKEQIILMQQNNIADKTVAEEILNRPLLSTNNFWIKELN